MLGAALIAHNTKIIPLRQARGWHLDPPDAPHAWRAKFATAPGRIALYRDLLTQPVDARTRANLTTECRALIREAATLR